MSVAIQTNFVHIALDSVVEELGNETPNASGPIKKTSFPFEITILYAEGF